MSTRNLHVLTRRVSSLVFGAAYLCVVLDEDAISPEEDDTVSSASMCMSPRSADVSAAAPLCASTPRAPPTARATPAPPRATEAATSCNGLDQIDNKRKSDNNSNYREHTNGNVIEVNVVSQSTNSIDVLSAGESDAGDTLHRNKQNNNSISSSSARAGRRRGTDELLYCIAKELLMTERTYKRDLELVTVTWSNRVSSLAGSGVIGGAEGAGAGAELVEGLGRPCLALEPLALPQGAFLARLERCLAAEAASPASPATPASTASPDNNNDDPEQPEYKKICQMLYDYVSSTYNAYGAYVGRAGALAARAESVRRWGGAGAAAGAAQDAAAALPLSCLILRPLHRLLYYRGRADELSQWCGCVASRALAAACSRLATGARDQLRHAENHAALCQLQRDILGYDKLLVADREFLRLGCLYKHSSKGLQQKMFFLFSDILICASKPGGTAQFRAQSVLPLHTLELLPGDSPHSFTLNYGETSLLLSASTEPECVGWVRALTLAIQQAPPQLQEDEQVHAPVHVDDELTTAATGPGGALAHVCWHRATSLSRRHLHLAMTTQLSGYLLRKFKNSHGWQKLWVVFAAFALFFYKSWQDVQPLASLPLLGYSVMCPSEEDGIHKEFVFKLQFKNHVYFFRADTRYTYNRWMEVLQQAMIHSQQQ